MIISSAGIPVQAYNGNNIQSTPIKIENGTEKEVLGEYNKSETDTLQTEKIEEQISSEEEKKPEEQISSEEEKKPEEQISSEEEKKPEEPSVSKKIKTGNLNFIIQENSYIQIPGVQNVVASLGEEGTAVEHAQLQYKNIETDEEFVTETIGIVDNMVRFSIAYNKEEQTGIYELLSVTWQTNGQDYKVVLSEVDMKIVYGVNKEIETEPDDVLIDKELLEEVEANVVTLDENGNTISEASVEDVLESAKTAGNNSVFKDSVVRGAKTMVIVLDPGHDNTHAGARGNGCKEEELTLKIALYCKSELQKYSGINVYMTRETGDCPNGGWTVDSGTCNARRVDFAKSKGADVYVSFHLNSSPSTTPRGVGVYYPNGNYRPEIGEEGKGLATAIYEKLAALGLSTWAGGILIRNSENNTLYPDGSLADYLGVIRRSKEYGFPAVLIEHAFLSNTADVTEFLSSEAKLKNLGVSDAHGIAAFYGLSLKGKTPEIAWIQSRNSQRLRVRWDKVTDAVSYQVYRSDSENGKYKKIAEVTGNTYDDGKVNTNTMYYYKIRAMYSDGSKSKYSKVQAGKAFAKAKITEVTAKAEGKLKIAWSGIEGVNEYELWRSESQSGGYEKIASIAPNKTSYTDYNVKTQKTYYYKVRGRGGDKNGYSSYSDILSGWAVKKTSITSVSSKTSTSLQIKWKKVSNAYAYRIQRSTSLNGTYQTIATVKSANTTTYVDQGVTEGKKYYYRIQVTNRVNKKNGYSGYCKSKAGSTISATTILYVKSLNSNSMEIKWEKDPDASAYRVKRSRKKDGNYEKVADIKYGNTTKYVDKKITSGKRYYYVVETVIDKKGVKNYSGDSKPATAVNIAVVPVKSMQVKNSGLQISWDKVAGTNAYQIMRSTEEKGTYKEIAKLDGSTSTTYIDKDVKTWNRYYYKIRAIKKGKYTGYGSFTSPIEKWVIAAPENIKVVPQKVNQIKISWKKMEHATGYEILRSTKRNSGYQVLTTRSSDQKTSYVDKTVVPGKTYYYKVAAFVQVGKESGKSDESTPLSGKTEVEQSEITSIKLNTKKAFVVKWKEVVGASGYEIQRSTRKDRDFKVIGKMNKKTLTLTDANLKKGTYYYRVRTVWTKDGKKYYSPYSEAKSGKIS